MNASHPIESPSHPSYGRHSRNSSFSRFSGIFRSSSGKKGGKKSNDKGWPECNVIVEEGDYDDGDGLTRRSQTLIALLGFIVLFTVFCLIIWGASRPFKAEVTVKESFTDIPFIISPRFTFKVSLHLLGVLVAYITPPLTPTATPKVYSTNGSPRRYSDDDEATADGDEAAT
ncbi:hypothetical protein POM88_013622 [Heracleum sosnowskyi]|uniref:Transmembrane protein n=1 Tax=Heracleum sosnowskyi TaxID=360622 RepID=A0AAD8IZG7_9APIA|nr:hypothetical protein POM88_013622 [Heracleum sosnowskyi]